MRSLASILVVVAACSGESGEDGGVLFELPQIVPEQTPLCLSYMDSVVNQPRTANLQLRNDGRQQLVIEGAQIVNDARSAFTVQGISPMTVESRESAIVQFIYQPPETGWDSAELMIASNAENYPMLRVFILARAVPQSLDGGVFDAGDKPMAARGPDGVYACDEMFRN